MQTLGQLGNACRKVNETSRLKRGGNKYQKICIIKQWEDSFQYINGEGSGNYVISM